MIKDPQTMFTALKTGEIDGAARSVSPELVKEWTADPQIELALEAIGDDPDGFAALVARGYGLHAGAGPELVPSAALVRLRAGSALPPFASPGQARAAMAGDTSGALGRLFVGDAYADIALAYDGVDPAATLTLVAKLTAPLPPDVFVDNHIIDAGPGGITLREIAGPFQGPLTLPAPGAAPTH